ncbi:protein Wnt-5 [Drosophila novamexicana]|uniref:protein Wnt-5 n=1 Tax=Drosophila novamexicana TaxID=47314 RepID=UPI0011E5F2AC|nr:protein Wnt-5 [Drosophila novamexicana]XP_030556379.1 protein Wnt-5 [Drosophila novamexicana]XP_030556457.1 protein Wnt-5 [Drosophila novamexicana]XP_030556526.1 protein Wnt-5 [Drosophila novamexicana]
MSFLVRKHFLLWNIIMTFVPLSVAGLDAITGLQGVPTWICLGIRSPFIEFGAQEEQLANTSIPLNITKDEQAYMHKEGLRKLGTFIKPVDLRDSETGYVKADLTKRLETPSAQARRVHPIQEEMDQKQIILLDEDTDENGLPASLTDEDRKFIVPMALKNASPELRWAVPGKTPVATSTTPTRSGVASAATRRRSTTTFTSTTPPPDPTSNIDDLKKHILFLHNMTKSDNNFESKFVKFPSLQKEKAKQSTGSTPSIKRPQRPILQYAAPIAPPTRKVPLGAHTPGQKPFGGYYHNEEETNNFFQTIDTSGTIDRSKERGNAFDTVPQVHLLSEGQSTSTKSVPMTTTPSILDTTSKRTTKRPVCLRNPDSPKCVRQRQREEQQRQRERDEWFRGQAEFMRPRFEPIVQTINNTKRFAVSIEIPDSFKGQSALTPSDEAPALQILSRVTRSQPKRRYLSGSQGYQAAVSVDKLSPPANYFAHDIIMTSAGVSNDRDFMLANMHQFGMMVPKDQDNETTPTPMAYSETIDLNPDNCYALDGLTYGQKKLCALHTSVMPAISRGARASIQECQFQFKNRRWNCSTTDDVTVFGPMTGLGSPEMAFIHALAAATVTSFIARACRDGQLTSCGCSRGSRPKQLHDDWTWGGCGDNLEYAYKFATDFIDVREKETRRGTRGAGNPERRGTHQLQQKRKQMEANGTKDTGESNLNITNSKTTKQLPNEALTDNNATSAILYELQANATNKNKDIFLDTNSTINSTSFAPPKQDEEARTSPDDLLELQQRITKEILNSKLKETEMLELQEKINREILNSKLFHGDTNAKRRKRKRKNQRAVSGEAPFLSNTNMKARSLMNLHNNEAGRRAVIKKTRITCKCHGVSGSCSLITCWQQLSSIREIGDYLREKYEEATEVKLNKRGRLQVKNSEFKVPTAHDLIYLDESPDWCRTNRLLQWSGTHGRVCNKSSSGLDGCGILCCGRGYNTKNIIVRERCNCKFHWCCQVKCDVCTKVLEEHTCK